MEESEHRVWNGRTWGGSFGHRFLFLLMKVTPLWLAYFFMSFGVCCFLAAHSSERKSIYRYFRYIHNYGWLRSSYMVLLNHFRFGQVIIDRFAVYARGEKAVKVEISEPDEFIPLTEQKQGIIVAGAHFGNLEIAGYSLSQDRKKIHIFAYSGEESTMQNHRESAFNRNDVIMEHIGNDMSHLFAIKNILDDGDIVQMMCDRFAGKEKGMDVSFLGHPAAFPVGMFRIADMMKIPIVTFFVARTGYRRYRIYTRQMKSDPEQDNVKVMLWQYVSHLGEMVRAYPEQWFNYYDFWKKYGN